MILKGDLLPPSGVAAPQRRTETRGLARFSHHLTVEARNKPAITALRLLAVLNVLFKYASARRAARALYRRASHAVRLATW